MNSPERMSISASFSLPRLRSATLKRAVREGKEGRRQRRGESESAREKGRGKEGERDEREAGRS
jgi:hypothetical protein